MHHLVPYTSAKMMWLVRQPEVISGVKVRQVSKVIFFAVWPPDGTETGSNRRQGGVPGTRSNPLKKTLDRSEMDDLSDRFETFVPLAAWLDGL